MCVYMCVYIYPLCDGRRTVAHIQDGTRYSSASSRATADSLGRKNRKAQGWHELENTCISAAVRDVHVNTK